MVAFDSERSTNAAQKIKKIIKTNDQILILIQPPPWPVFLLYPS